MRFRRALWLSWLALALNVLAPVIAYAHIQHEIGGGDVWCPADPAPVAHVHDHHDGDADHHTGPQSKHSLTPHCPYCPGFSAGAPLVAIAANSAGGAQEQARFVPAYLEAPAARASVRIAQPRAPPFQS